MKGKLIYWNGVFIVILAVVIVANIIAVSYDNILRVFLGSFGTNVESFEGSSYDSTAELRKAQEEFSEELMAEGAVILKNERDALPLQTSSLKVSVFGQNSVKPVRGGVGSGAVSAESYGDVSVKNVLSSAGFSVNESLWDYYDNHAGRTSETGGDYKCYESDWAELTASDGVRNSFSEYGDVAIVILSRLGSEAADLPLVNGVDKGGDGENSYLALTVKERDMLRGIESSGLFKKTVVVLNTGNAMQLDFLAKPEYGVDGCILFGMTGVYGLSALPDILLGNSDPSGRLNDTYVYDAKSAPATRNFGDARYVNASVTPPNDTRSTVYESENYGSSEFSYVNYAEGIYVGYKYYETRYEDYVSGATNVGDYDYGKEVCFPFGYGKSYTDFEWSGYSAELRGDEVIVRTTVRNTGSKAGKEVVQVYFQSPYIAGGAEKASVNLAGFAKTKLLQPGQSEEVEVKFNARDAMKSYDSTCTVAGRSERGAYVLDQGTYYVTAAPDAHRAINNILLRKNDAVEQNRMYGEGNAGFASEIFTLTSREIIHTDDKTGEEVMNLFEDALAPDSTDSTYLHRNNWKILDEENGLKYSTGTGNLIAKSKSTGEVVNVSEFETRTASDAEIDKIKAVGWAVAGRPESADDHTAVALGQSNGAVIREAKGADFDAEVWDRILSNLTLNDLKNSFLNGAFSTVAFSSIEKPATVELDGPSGITNFTNGHGGFGFPSTSVLARTFNVELADRYGRLVAEDGLRMGVYGWYAPCVNLDRTPFTARSYESYSEDAYLTGAMAVAEIKGCQAKGMYVYVKHFALNEQGVNRNYICTWGQEQAFREIYFKPFEMCVKEGGATGIMASMNRIGYKLARGNYNLLTALLKTEWGFDGAVVTDAITYGSSVAHTEQALAAGTDLMLNSTRVSLSDELLKNAYAVNRLYDAAHRVCYMAVNSGAIETIGGGGMPVYCLILILADVVAFLAVAIADFFLIRKYMKSKKEVRSEV